MLRKKSVTLKFIQKESEEQEHVQAFSTVGFLLDVKLFNLYNNKM